MTASRILETLAEEIRAGWAAGRRCRVTVAPDPASAAELLAAGAPDGAALSLWFEGDSTADDRGLVCDGQREGRFRLALAAHPGLREREAAPGALRMAESLRRFVLREASGEGLLDGWRPGGMDSFTLSRGDVPTGGYSLALLGCYDCGDDENEEES